MVFYSTSFQFSLGLLLIYLNCHLFHLMVILSFLGVNLETVGLDKILFFMQTAI